MCLYTVILVIPNEDLVNFSGTYIKLSVKGTVHCLRSRLSIFVYIRNNVCVIYVHGNHIWDYSEP